MIATGKILAAICLVAVARLASAADSCEMMFGYEVGQQLDKSRIVEYRLKGIVVVEPIGLSGGLKELSLLVTPKTYTIMAIRGTTRSDNIEDLERLKSEYRRYLRSSCADWFISGGPNLTLVRKEPLMFRLSTRRTRSDGIFELVVSLGFSYESEQRRALEEQRLNEAADIVAGATNLKKRGQIYFYKNKSDPFLVSRFVVSGIRIRADPISDC